MAACLHSEPYLVAVHQPINGELGRERSAARLQGGRKGTETSCTPAFPEQKPTTSRLIRRFV